MQSILEELAYGNIKPAARFFTQSVQYGEAARALSGSGEKLLALLDEEGKLLFQKYTDAQSEVCRLTAVGNMIYGFKLGLMMTAEAFVTGGELTEEGEGG